MSRARKPQCGENVIELSTNFGMILFVTKKCTNAQWIFASNVPIESLCNELLKKIV